jgi:hypothetical protein
MLRPLPVRRFSGSLARLAVPILQGRGPVGSDPPERLGAARKGGLSPRFETDFCDVRRVTAARKGQISSAVLR